MDKCRESRSSDPEVHVVESKNTKYRTYILKTAHLQVVRQTPRIDVHKGKWCSAFLLYTLVYIYKA